MNISWKTSFVYHLVLYGRLYVYEYAVFQNMGKMENALCGIKCLVYIGVDIF